MPAMYTGVKNSNKEQFFSEHAASVTMQTMLDQKDFYGLQKCEEWLFFQHRSHAKVASWLYGQTLSSDLAWQYLNGIRRIT